MRTSNELSDAEKSAILCSLFQAIPKKIRDKHTSLGKNGTTVQVCTDVLLKLNQQFSCDRATVSVKFYYPVQGRGKVWPVRKDRTINVEAIMAYVVKCLDETKAKEKAEKKGERLSRKLAKELQSSLDGDKRLKKLGLIPVTNHIFRDAEGRVRVAFEIEGTEHEWGGRDEALSADYYPDEGYKIVLRESGLSQDQIIRILKIVREGK